jgi:hypothetical protein
MFLREHGVSDGKQRRISAVNAETVYARYNARYGVIIPYSLGNMESPTEKQRRISAVNAETVYARYNARYAVIIPYFLGNMVSPTENSAGFLR